MNYNEIKSLNDVNPGDTVLLLDRGYAGRNRGAYEVEVVRVTKTRVTVKSPFDYGEREIVFQKESGHEFKKTSSLYRNRIAVGDVASKEFPSAAEAMMYDDIERMTNSAWKFASSRDPLEKIEDQLVVVLDRIKKYRESVR